MWREKQYDLREEDDDYHFSVDEASFNVSKVFGCLV